MFKFQRTKKCVWELKTETGFDQRVFIMYHSTTDAWMAENILRDGFIPSDSYSNMLGSGIYVSTELEKCLAYGDITFKLLVYPGQFKPIKYQDHPRQKNWQEDYGCAWVPPNCGMVRSGLEVSCYPQA